MLVGKRNGVATMGDSLEDPQKVKNRTTLLLFRNPTSIYLKELKSESQRDISTSMLTVALFTTAKMWKPKCPSTG